MIHPDNGSFALGIALAGLLFLAWRIIVTNWK
jgi:hypothetical protein